MQAWGLDGSRDVLIEVDDSGLPIDGGIQSAFPVTKHVNETAFDRINQMIANGGNLTLCQVHH